MAEATSDREVTVGGMTAGAWVTLGASLAVGGQTMTATPSPRSLRPAFLEANSEETWASCPPRTGTGACLGGAGWTGASGAATAAASGPCPESLCQCLSSPDHDCPPEGLGP